MMTTHRRFHQGLTSPGCTGARCAACQPTGHKGAPVADETLLLRQMGVCAGRHCAGRLRVHEHRGESIPNHVTVRR